MRDHRPQGSPLVFVYHDFDRWLLGWSHPRRLPKLRPYGQIALALTPLELLDRLPALISPPWRHRLESAFPLRTFLPVKVP